MASETMMQGPMFGYHSPKKMATGPPHSYEFEMGVSPESFAPVFQFRRRLGEINWRKIAMIDVEKIARELDIDMLQEHIQTVAFCNIDVIADLDPMFAKLFKLAQFMIEYMLHSQASLQAIIAELEGKLELAATQQNSAQDRIKQLESDVEKLKSENKKRRKMIEQQQMLIESGASSYYKCPHCQKAFVNASFLQGHMQRKHPGSVNYIGDVIAHSQREQSRLAGKLDGLDADMQKERVTFHEKIKKVEEEKAAWGARTRRDMDRWKKEEEGKWRKELETMKKSFITEIGQLKAQETEYKKKITNLETSMERHSNLGELVDDIEGDKQKLTERIRTLEETNLAKEAKLRRLASEMAHLKEQSRNDLDDHERRISSTYDAELRKLKWEMDRQGKKKKEKVVYIPPPVAEKQPEFDDEEVSIDDRLSEIRKLKAAFKKQMRPILEKVMMDKLGDCGVDPKAPGISTKTLTNKLMVRKTERQRIAKKQPGYYGIRDDIKKKVDAEANRRFRGSPARRKRNQTPSRLPKNRVPSNTTYSADHSPSRRTHPAGTLGHAPSPVRRNKLGAVQGGRDQTMTREELNTRFGDDDESYWDSEASDMDVGPAQTRQGPSHPHQRNKRSPATPKTITAPKDDDSWVSDAMDEILSLDTEVRERKPTQKSSSPLHQRNKRSPATPKTTTAPEDDDSWDSDAMDDILSPETEVRERKPNQEKTRVREIGANIEAQMQNRRGKKPPAGAVNVIPSSSTPVQIPNAESDDEFSQVSSLHGESPQPAPRKSPTKVGQSTNTMSSGGTSVWGSGHGKPANAKDDEVVLSDWDDISEL